MRERLLRLEVHEHVGVRELKVEVADGDAIELRLSERDRGVHRQRRRARTALAVREDDDASAALQRRARERLHALEEDLDLRREDGHLDRLRHVLVGALGISRQHVVGLLARGEHHDRQAGGLVVRAESPRQFEAVHVRHAHVRDDEVGHARADGLQSLVAVGRERDLVTLPRQIGRQELADLLLIVDEQDVTHPVRASSSQLGAARFAAASRCR